MRRCSSGPTNWSPVSTGWMTRKRRSPPTFPCSTMWPAVTRPSPRRCYSWAVSPVVGAHRAGTPLGRGVPVDAPAGTPAAPWTRRPGPVGGLLASPRGGIPQPRLPQEAHAGRRPGRPERVARPGRPHRVPVRERRAVPSAEDADRADAATPRGHPRWQCHGTGLAGGRRRRGGDGQGRPPPQQPRSPGPAPARGRRPAGSRRPAGGIPARPARDRPLPGHPRRPRSRRPATSHRPR